MRRLFAILSIAFLLTAPAAQADTVTFSEPEFDRWMYPFNGSNGTRATSPVFGAVGSPDFDEFDGQMLLGFNTDAMGVPTQAELPPGMKYQINSVTVTATHAGSSAFTYDATFDPYETYLDISDPDHQLDTDASRPIELYGVGTRPPYGNLSFIPSSGGNAGPPFFEEGDVFALGNPQSKRVRNAFAYDPSVGDVSNPVADRLFNLEPWAIGQTNVAPGTSILPAVGGSSAGSTFTFSLDLSRPDIVNYLTTGLGNGELFFSIVSLFETSQTGGSNPDFYTAENFDPAAIPATLTLDYSVVPVPEPATWALAACAAGLALPYWWRRRRSARATQP